MARRVITPELFEDEWFGSLQDREQLAWVGLFGVLADDQGRLQDNPALIRSRLWPYRDVPASDVAAALDHFAADARLHRYEVGGARLLQIVTWWKHQKPQWAAQSAFPAPPNWRDRVRTRQNGVYLEDGWKEPGGFTSCVQVNGSGDGAQVNGSGEPFGLARGRAHEPEPVPEPVKRTPLPPEPVDNCAEQERGDSRESTEQGQGSGSALDTLRSNPTCDGRECVVRRLHVGMRATVGEIVGPGDVGKLYNPTSPIHKSLAGMAGYVCAACWSASRDPALTMEDRQPLCIRALREYVDTVAAFHRAQPIRRLPGFLRKRYENMTEAPVSDDVLADLRRLERRGRNGRDPDSEPARIGDVLRDLVPQSPAVTAAAEDGAQAVPSNREGHPA